MLEVSKAIIYHHNDYLLQLRDHTPGIGDAGDWSVLGGASEAGETPWQARQRELAEELEWQPDTGIYLYDWVNPDHPCQVHFFVVPFTGKRSALVLHEGQDLGWFNLDEVAHHSQMAPHVSQHLKCAHNHLSDSDQSLTADVLLRSENNAT